MTYTKDKPAPPETAEQLRARIPGWGVDLDPADRPSFPQERYAPEVTGAHWDFPERQPERWPRERSIEHAFLTPVFGTSCPPKGLSGAVRKLAYRRFSEADAAHWLLLLAADRVDVVETTVTSLVSRRPNVPFVGTGLRAEVSHHGIASRVGRDRADVKHHVLDPFVVAGPWLVGGLAAAAAVRRLRRR